MIGYGGGDVFASLVVFLLVLLATVGLVVLFLFREKNAATITLLSVGGLAFIISVFVLLMRGFWGWYLVSLLMDVCVGIPLIFVGKKQPDGSSPAQRPAAQKTTPARTARPRPTPAHADRSKPASAKPAPAKPASGKAAPPPTPAPKPGKQAPAPGCVSVTLMAASYDISKLKEKGEAFSAALADLVLTDQTMILFGESLVRVAALDPSPRARVVATTAVNIQTSSQPIPVTCPACGKIQEMLDENCEGCGKPLPLIFTEG